MFAGIVQTTGELKTREEKSGKIYFQIKVKNFLKDIKIGDSISCDGVCLTVIKKGADSFTVELMPETLKLTRFKDSKAGDLINLEKSLKLRERIDGHFVMGHVDGVGKVKEVTHPAPSGHPSQEDTHPAPSGHPSQEGMYTDLVIKVPRKVSKYLAYKGSVSINGVSLTIAGEGKDWIKVCLISHTLEVTNLSELKKGSLVNLEVDMIARYLEKFLREEKRN